MVGEREAAGMSYHEYKVTVWSRLCEFWRARLHDRRLHPDAHERLAACEARLKEFAAPARGKRNRPSRRSAASRV